MIDARLAQETPAMMIANDIMSIRQTGSWDDFHEIAKAAVAAAVAAEREVCATLAEEPPPIGGPTHGAWDRGYLDGRKAAAAAIRARK